MTNTTTYTIQYQKILYNAINIAYVDEGTGDYTLLMLHGLGNSLIGWELNIQQLSKHHRCIAIDLPGNGLSQKDETYPYSMEFYANAVADFIKQMGLKNVVLVGHSMGGQIAMRMAINYPDLVAKLVLVASAGIERFSSLEKTLMNTSMQMLNLFSTDAQNLSQALNASFYTMPQNAGKLIDRLVKLLELQPRVHYSKMVKKCINAMIEEPVWDEIPKIKCNTLILFGNMDNLIPNKLIHPISVASLVDEGKSQFQYAKSIIITHAGHFVHWEKAEEVNKGIEEFLG